MAVIILDVSVLAGYLLGVDPAREELPGFFRGSHDFIAPDIWRPELANTFWKYVQKQAIKLDEAVALFQSAETLISHTVSSRGLWQSALLLASQNNHPVYDCLYIALALEKSTQVITYDQRLWARFSDLAVGPREISFLQR